MQEKDFLAKLHQFEEVDVESDEREFMNTKPKAADCIMLEEYNKKMSEKYAKFILRLPNHISAEVREEARKEGVSLNQYFLTAVAFYKGYLAGKTDSK